MAYDQNSYSAPRRGYQQPQQYAPQYGYDQGYEYDSRHGHAQADGWTNYAQQPGGHQDYGYQTQQRGYNQGYQQEQYGYGQQEQYGHRQQEHYGNGYAQREQRYDSGYAQQAQHDPYQGYAGHQQQQPQQQYEERRYDPRYQQREQASPQRQQRQSPPQKAVPTKMSMDEWKAQEKAKMHEALKGPKVLPQDNAFPTFPTKKEPGRGQSSMSHRSGEERPSTAHAGERRPQTSRENSYQKPTGSARPSMDSQHRPQPDRFGSPLNDQQGSPAHRPPPPRKDSYSTASLKSPPARPLAIDTNHSQGYQPQSPVRERPGSSDSRRRPEQPMSPLGKFAQSADSRPQHESLQSAIDDVYKGYSDISKPEKTLTREEEIEAEMPDFGAPAKTHAESSDSFDFGFSGQRSASTRPAAEDYAGFASSPYANDTRQLPIRDGASPARPMPQRTYDTRQPSLDKPAAPWANPAIQRPGSAPPEQDRRGGYGVQNYSNPDALPAHPTPVRPGLMNGGAPHPAPVRQYNQGRSTPQPQVQQVRQQDSRPASGETEVPITQQELQRLKAEVDANPNSNKLVLHYAKKLVEAAKVLANDGGRADPKVAAKNRERYIMEAYKRVKKLASAGYPDAQFYLADCYGCGALGLDTDPKEAFRYYQAAAKAGHPAAAYRTAVCCELGTEDGGGTSKDYPRAVQWYKRAAALGDTAAMFKIGMIALKGLLGQPRHLGEAVIWLKRAAERADKNNPHALYELGVLYETANSTPEIRQKVIPDDQYALQLYQQAATWGNKSAQRRLGQAFEYGTLGLPVDHRASISWYSKAAAQGEHQAELALSGWYLTGAPGILEVNEQEAFLWARKSARAEPPNAQAMFACAYFLEMGIGCQVNTDEAKRWYSRAASYKHPKALERLEMMRRGIKGGYRGQSMKGKLARKDQKMDEAECSVM